MQAVLLTVLLVSLMGMCYGMAEYFLNSISGGKAGTVIISIWSLSWLCLSNLSGNLVVRRILQVSPQQWLNLEGVSIDKLGRKCMIIIIVILLLAAANLLPEKKKEA